MEHIKKQLNININKKGLAKIAESSQVCYVFEKNKKEILGKDIFANAISFSKGVLKLGAEDSIVSSEIKLKENAIKKELNKKLKEEIVLKIRTEITS